MRRERDLKCSRLSKLSKLVNQTKPISKDAYTVARCVAKRVVWAAKFEGEKEVFRDISPNDTSVLESSHSVMRKR